MTFEGLFALDELQSAPFVRVSLDLLVRMKTCVFLFLDCKSENLAFELRRCRRNERATRSRVEIERRQSWEHVMERTGKRD